MRTQNPAATHAQQWLSKAPPQDLRRPRSVIPTPHKIRELFSRNPCAPPFPCNRKPREATDDHHHP